MIAIIEAKQDRPSNYAGRVSDPIVSCRLGRLDTDLLFSYRREIEVEFRGR